jgi:hypothetical protein
MPRERILNGSYLKQPGSKKWTDYFEKIKKAIEEMFQAKGLRP